MNICGKVKEIVMTANQTYIENNPDDEFDFWNEHLKMVVSHSLSLAQEFGADLEVVELGALLHDIALMMQVETKKEHHINGAKIAEQILLDLNYNKEKTERVKNIVLHHRSSKNAQNIEELCVADADIMSHFDNVLMMCECTFGRGKFTLEKGRENLKRKMAEDFDDMSPQSQKLYKDRYNLIMNILFPNYC